MSDLAVALSVLGGAATGLGALAVAYREKARRSALEAERALENERQETKMQDHVVERLATMERRVDTQAEHMATQAQQISGLTTENREQAKLLAKQAAVIKRQAQHVGDQARTIRAQAVRIEQLELDVVRKDKDNAALAVQLNELRHDIWTSRGKPSGLPSELYGAEPPADVRLPKPPKVPKF